MNFLRHTSPLPQSTPAPLVGKEKDKQTMTKRKKFLTRRRKKKAATTTVTTEDSIENGATTTTEDSEAKAKKKKKKKRRSWAVRARKEEPAVLSPNREQFIRSFGYAAGINCSPTRRRPNRKPSPPPSPTVPSPKRRRTNL